MTVLDSHADGIAEELERPYRTVEIDERDHANGYLMRVTPTEEFPLRSREFDWVIEAGWSFVAFIDDGYALFQRGPMGFEDDQ